MFMRISLPKALITAVVAASMGPIAAILFAHFRNLPPPSAGLLAQGYFMNYLVVWLVARTAKQIHLMNRELSHARRMGSYELGKLLGQGGMGEVWQATHRMLRRPAAIKLIRPEALGATDSKGRETVLRRFEREAQATAELHSQHTIRLYDFGATSEGTLFYVMELLDGVNLRVLIERFGPQPASRTAHLLLQACDSLWDAHQSGLVHRDIKPANLYVCRYGHQYDFVKVLDFGLVRPSGGSWAEETRITQAGIMTGTPAFIAPEIAKEGGGDVQSDIYALGCVAYWMLTGQLVFQRENLLQTALAHIQEEPIPPSQRTEMEIPPSFEKLLLSCLEKDPARRPQNARELAETLRAIGCHTDWTPERAAAWWEAHSPGLARSAG
jgi:serine/threonine-protein kinase